MRPKKGNYIYEMFYYNHPFYSYNALKNIKVQRRLTSDLLDISYTSGDPGIAYNTVSILMDEFVEEYRRIRYGETDKVIKYFEEELKRIGKKLNSEEDDLTKYNVEKRIINYLDETKEIAAISKEFELREQDALFAYNSTKSMLEELEKHMDSNAKQVLKNMEFVDKLREASNITSKISEVEAMSDSKQKDTESLTGDKKRLSELKQELNDLTTCTKCPSGIERPLCIFCPCGYHHQAKRTFHQLYGTQLPDRVTKLQRSPVKKEKSGNDFCYIESAQ